MAKHDNTQLRSKKAFVQQNGTSVPNYLCRSVPPCTLTRHRLVGTSKTSWKGPEFTNEPSIQDVCLGVPVVSSEEAHVPMNCYVYREGRGGWKLYRRLYFLSSSHLLSQWVWVPMNVQWRCRALNTDIYPLAPFWGFFYESLRTHPLQTANWK